MAYNEVLAQRVRDILGELPGYEEKKMFGGVGYLLHGNMACGVHKDYLIVRVGPDLYQTALTAPHTKEFDMTGRPMTGWVEVKLEGCRDDGDLTRWIEQGVTYALSLPAK